MRRLTDLERDRASVDQSGFSPRSAPVKNYITINGYSRLKKELQNLLEKERPELVKIIAWAASNGDRSENADYIYGKRRLREIDRRVRFLTKRLEIVEIIDPARQGLDQIFFGATVSYRNGKNVECTVSIVGEDEIDPLRGYISWISPVARALHKLRRGDSVTLTTPVGAEELEVLDVRYVPLAT